MSPGGRTVRWAVAVGLGWAVAPPAVASPTMIRLGYDECASCHVSPQGAGPLNVYGRGMDKAQSLVGGEYEPSEDPVVRLLNGRGRINHDLRVVMQAQARWAGSQAVPGTFRPRVMYRNTTEVGGGFRLSATAMWEDGPPPSPLVYERGPHRSPLSLRTALVHYRPGKTLEFAAGRDHLPTGINLPDRDMFVRSRNRLGYDDSPTQVKAFWWGRRHAFMPFAYLPSGNEADGERESGFGGLYEVDLFGKQKTKLGFSFLHGTARNGHRRLGGAYARVGFGRWGLLAEHDVTDRWRKVPDSVSFRQHTTYAQVFWAVREWLVTSAIGERLEVASPFAQHLMAGKIEVAARLASQATLVAGARIERDRATGRLSRSLSVNIALKTVD